MPPSAGFVRQQSDAYFAERQNVWEQKLQGNIAIPPGMPARMILISFFLSGGFQVTAHNRHWNWKCRKDNVIPNGNIRPGQNHLQ